MEETLYSSSVVRCALYLSVVMDPPVREYVSLECRTDRCCVPRHSSIVIRFRDMIGGLIKLRCLKLCLDRGKKLIAWQMYQALCVPFD